MKDVKLSEYQKNIEQFALHGNGNALINAYAGTGKSFTLVHILKILPEESTKIYCAFNKDIVNDIKNKTQEINNLSIKTIHSIGYSIVRANNDVDIIVDENKYYLHIKNNINEYSSTIENLTYNQQQKFKTNLYKLIKFCRQNLCDGRKCIAEIAEKFDINLLGDEVECCVKILKWGKQNINIIDNTDMIWLPNILPYRCPHFDYVLVDECQDLSIAQQELVKKLRNNKTRYFYAGDKNQAIYSFAGSDSESFNKIASLPNLTIFQLPICYRCGARIVRLAAQMVNGIKESETAELGNIVFNSTIKDIKTSDAVICRSNAPLFKLYNYFIENDIKCHILGKDIGDGLIETIKNINKEELSIDLEQDGLFVSLYDELFNIKYTIQHAEKCDDKTAISTTQFREFYDKIKTLEVLSINCANSQDLINKINTIFQNDKKDGIILSTVHKSKGLEWDNVHILCPSIFHQNMKRTSHQWEREQEENLQYVALTRAKHNLYYIEDDDYVTTSYQINIQELNEKEYQVDKVLKKQKRDKILTLEYAKKIVNNYETIETNIKPHNVVDLSNINNNKSKLRDLRVGIKNKLKKL